MLARTLWYDAKCGMANQNVATTRTAAITARVILRPRRGRLPVTACVPASPFVPASPLVPPSPCVPASPCVPITHRSAGSARCGRSSVSWMASPAVDQVIGQQQHNSARDRGDPGGEVEEALQGVDVEQFGGEPAARPRTDDADRAGDDDAL